MWQAPVLESTCTTTVPWGEDGVEVGLVFLGTSAAVPTRERGLPSIAYVYRGTVVLLDAGEGTQRALQMYGLSPLRVEAVLVTHMHGDHVFGLPGLLQSMAMLGRKHLLTIIGPKGLHKFVTEAAKATYWLPSYPVAVYEASPGDKYRLPSGIEVEVFKTCHRIPSLGFKLVEPPRKPRVDLEAAKRLGIRPGPLLGKLQAGEAVVVRGRVVKPEEVVRPQPRLVVAYTGDTSPCSEVIEAVRGSDVLVMDATFTSDMAEEAYEEGHATARDAALVAAKTGVKLLVLIHISARYEDDEPLLSDAKRFFWNTHVARDGAKLVLRP